MADFERTISKLQSRLCSGANELPLWQAKAVQHWYTVFVHNTKSHHDHEEQVGCCLALTGSMPPLKVQFQVCQFG